MNYTLEQLEEARAALEQRLRAARAGVDYLNAEHLPRLIALVALGEDRQAEIEETRRQLAESRVILDETPGALVVLKSMIEQARNREAQEQRERELANNRQAYFELRQRIIDNPKLVNEQGGTLRTLAANIDRYGKLHEEAKNLTEKAEYFVLYQHSGEVFSFNVLASE